MLLKLRDSHFAATLLFLLLPKYGYGFERVTSVLFHLEYMKLIINPKFSNLIKNYVGKWRVNYVENIKA